MEDNISQVSWPGWEVVRRIGSGSFGTVYEIQRDVYGDIEKAALKVIRIPHSEDEVDYLRCSGVDDESITRAFHQQVGDIAREYKLMSQIKENPNVVRCDDFRDIQHDDGFGWDIYIKMELLTPLMKALDHLKTETQIIQLGKDICNALVACQAKNIIHRDIKPQNVFLSDSGRFKLGDFGIARTIEHTTRATAGIGTYSYMAPEVEKKQAYNMSVDIYSLGLMLYWLLNERRSPFMPLPPEIPKHDDEEKARHRRLAGEALPEPKNGSAALKTIVLKACAYKPEDRYQSAADMLAALNALETGAAPEPIPVIPPEPEDDPDKTVGPDWKNTDKPTDETAGQSPREEEEKTVGPDWEKSKKPKNEKRKWLFPVIAGLLAIAILITMLRFCGNVDTPSVPSDGTTAGQQSTTQIDGTTAPTTGETTVPPTTEEVIPPTTFSPTTTPEQTVPSTTVPEQTTPSTTAPHVHNWTAATCTEPMTCSACGATEGSAVGHKWAAATTEAPKTCTVCKLTEGNPLVKIISVSAANDRTFALKSDGTVLAMGHGYHGQCDVSNWTGVVSVSAGVDHTVGLKSNGTVVAVGNNNDGQCNVSDWTDIVAVSAGGLHTVGLKSDGTVVAVGSGAYGQCDVSGWTDIVAIAAGYLHTVGLKSDGTVVAVGNNRDGQCVVSHWTNIVSISAEGYNTVGLKSDGTVVGMGHLVLIDRFDVSNWKDIVSVSASNIRVVGIRSDGTVMAVGYNDYDHSEVSDWTDIVSVSTSGTHTVALKADGTVVATGDNDYHQCDVSVWNN